MIFPLLASALLWATGCQKDDAPEANAISEAEAADLVGAAVAIEEGGLVVQIQEAIVRDEGTQVTAAQQNTALCGFVKDGTFAHSSQPGQQVQYQFTYQTQLSYQCVDGAVDQATWTLNGSGMYDGPRRQTSFTSGGTWTLSQISGTGPYRFNGSFERSGTYELRLRNRGVTSQLSLNSEDIVVNRTSRQVESGTAFVNLSGQTAQRGAFSFTATLEFLGDQQGRLTVNGRSYLINLQTGEVMEG